MLAVIESLRLYVLFFSVPFTLMWARALSPTTGALLVATHACLILFWAVHAARSERMAGLRPRLGLTDTRSAVNDDALSVAFPLLAAFLAALSLALLISNFWIGVGAALAGLYAAWHGRLNLRDKYVRAELIGPVGLLIGPGLLFYMHAWEPPEAFEIFSEDPTRPAEVREALTAQVVRPDVISTEALAATLLGGAALAAAILLCQIRDVQRDRLRGVETTVAKIGRGGAVFLMWLWMLGLAGLGAMGAGWGWWHWSAALLAGWTAAATLALLADHRDAVATGVGYMGGALTGTVAALTVPPMHLAGV